MITISVEDPGSADAHALMEELSATLAHMTGDSGKASFDPNDVRATKARFVVARNVEHPNDLDIALDIDRYDFAVRVDLQDGRPVARIE
jgi:hypothetical protein